jgi:hypothetical protein
MTLSQQCLPHAIETIVGSIDCKNWDASVSFCHATISLEDNYFRPNFIVNLRPLVQHFLNVFLQNKNNENRFSNNFLQAFKLIMTTKLCNFDILTFPLRLTENNESRLIFVGLEAHKKNSPLTMLRKYITLLERNFNFTFRKLPREKR